MSGMRRVVESKIPRVGRMFIFSHRNWGRAAIFSGLWYYGAKCEKMLVSMIQI